MADFFSNSKDHETLIAERKAILLQHPERHAGLLLEGEPLLAEACELSAAMPNAAEDRPRTVVELGCHWEPDFLLLEQDAAGPRLVAGCVCFPSAWAFGEKMGQRMGAIHAVVPGLNESIGRSIDSFLEKLKPGRAWTRSNWGLSRSAQLNQHPDLRLPRLNEEVQVGDVFFRVEEQMLVSLPRTHGILFGIRVKVFPLVLFAGTEAGTLLAMKLRTMPAEMARYKGLGEARERIVELLEA